MNESGEKEATSAARLFALANDLLSTFANSFILIDAIDECSIEERRKLIDHLNDLVSLNTTTKVLILSREEADVKKALASFPSYAISSKDTSSDIERYLSDSLVDGAFKFNIQRPLRLEAQRRVSEGAAGSFLYVRLMVDALKSQPFDNYKQVQDAILNVPVGLGEAYGRVLQQLCKQPKHIRQTITIILRLLVVSFTPFTVTRLAQTLSKTGAVQTLSILEHENLRALIYSCLSTIITIDAADNISFTHQTVALFLTSPAEVWTVADGLTAQFRVGISGSHEDIATSSLRTLMATEYAVDGQNLYPYNDQDGSFAYAARFWIDHVVLVNTASSHFSDIIKQFLSTDQSVNWLKWRLQGATSLKMTIRVLLADASRLKLWAEKHYDNEGLVSMTSNMVPELYERWHKHLMSKDKDSDATTLCSSTTTLGYMYYSMGDYPRATTILEENKVQGVADTGKLQVIILQNAFALALVKARQGRWEEATTLNRQIMKEYENLPSVAPTEKLTVWESLGDTLMKGSGSLKGEPKQKMLAEAEEVISGSLNEKIRVLGIEHPDTIEGMHLLARLYIEQKCYDKAQQQFEKHLPLSKRLLGLEHRSYLGTLQDLGTLYDETGQLEQAEATYELVHNIRRRALGDEDPHLLDSAWYIGVVQQKRGDYMKSIATLASLMPGNERVYGRDHLYTMKPLARIGEMYIALGQNEEAIAPLERVVYHCDDNNGDPATENVELVEKCVQLLATAYEATGKKGKAAKLRQKDWTMEMRRSRKNDERVKYVSVQVLGSATLGICAIILLLWRWYRPSEA